MSNTTFKPEVIVEVAVKDSTTPEATVSMEKAKDIFDQVLVAELANNTQRAIESEEVQAEDTKQRLTIKERLVAIKDYVMSNAFVKKCKDKAKALNLPEKAVKNIYIGGLLRSLGRAIGVGIAITCDLIIGFVNFLAYLIKSVLTMAKSVANRIANFVSLGQV